MKTLAPALLALGAALLVAPAAYGQSIKVNGVTIPPTRVEMFVKELTAQGRPDNAELRKAVRDELINREVLSQEAVRRGLDKNVEIAVALDMARQNTLARALMQEILKTAKPSEDALRKEYERVKSGMGAREMKARHILVEKEDEARDITAQIRKGGSFEKLAAQHSKDPGSQGKGGELDWAPPSNYVKPFADALQRLKKGQMTDAPVQTQFGWHVIRLDDERALKVPAFEEVRANIEQNFMRQAQDKALADLRAKAKIE